MNDVAVVAGYLKVIDLAPFQGLFPDVSYDMPLLAVAHQRAVKLRAPVESVGWQARYILSLLHILPGVALPGTLAIPPFDTACAVEAELYAEEFRALPLAIKAEPGVPLLPHLHATTLAQGSDSHDALKAAPRLDMASNEGIRLRVSI